MNLFFNILYGISGSFLPPLISFRFCFIYLFFLLGVIFDVLDDFY